MATKDALELIFSRNAFYQRLHYYALAASVLSIMMILSLLTVLYYLLANPVHPLYFAADNVSRLIKITPVEAPNMTIDEVTQWTKEAVEATYSYDYINYRGQLQNAQKYFSPYGWQEFMRALSRSNNLLALTQRKQITEARVVGKPQIAKEGLLGGSYAWRFEMPVLVTYSQPPYDEKSKYTNALTVTVIVQRQQVLQAYKGLGIIQLVASLAGYSNQPKEISATPTM